MCVCMCAYLYICIYICNINIYKYKKLDGGRIPGFARLLQKSAKTFRVH